MHWLIQNNLKNDQGMQSLKYHLIDNKKSFKLVKAVTFIDIIINGDLDFDVIKSTEDTDSLLTVPKALNIITMGSYSLARSAIKRGWTPGAFINDNFEFSKWRKHWGADVMLNGGAIEAKIKDIKVPTDMTYVFARPSEDTKYFAVQVFERENFAFWLEQLKTINDPETLSPETSIIISKVVDIALTPNGPKIIEVNNINSSGFYACDIGKIVENIENMRF